jgi:phytoene/squalene synthetase
MVQSAFAACEELVRRNDPDRYYATLFAPEEKRPHLFALYALYRELAHAVQAAHEPMILDIRLAWWRETLEGARAGHARNHPVAQAMVATLAAFDLPQAEFSRMIEARAGDAGGPAFADAADAEEYANATTVTLMRLAARVLGGEADALAREAGIAYALAGQGNPRLRNVDAPAIARWHFKKAQRMALPRALFAAFLPAALVPLYLRRRDPPVWRRQVSLLRAGMRGRI